MIELLNDLKLNLLLYTELPVYKLNNSSKSHIAIIFIAVYLAELNLYMNRPIVENEKQWFEAANIIIHEFDHKESGEIYQKYLELCRMINDLYF